ncbi:hypothetical protein [Streptomyces anandii]|uniref:hypothetical protein n=1 Tax=Streptomyces anandii TaxID=285454 RepID=UPI0036935803
MAADPGRRPPRSASADVTAVTRGGGEPPDWADSHLAAAEPAVAERVRAADVVVTATSAREPVFDGRLVRDCAVVLAVGSHEPTARELDASLMGRATVVVESRDVALREAGDVVLAVREGALDPGSLLTLAEVLRHEAPVRPDRPMVVKTSGMAWEDLAVAVAVYQQGGRRLRPSPGLYRGPRARPRAAARVRRCGSAPPFRPRTERMRVNRLCADVRCAPAGVQGPPVFRWAVLAPVEPGVRSAFSGPDGDSPTG